MKRMNWGKLLSSVRMHEAPMEKADAVIRSEYERDISRITFSSTFRRLSRKAQVHPLVPNDNVHTRLSHSLETSRVGHGLGRALGDFIRQQGELPLGITPTDVGTIVQAACLAHDIGNPAFGHAGEEAIRRWLDKNPSMFREAKLTNEQYKDLALYEGNAQGFRIMTQIENHVFAGGLRLTAATLATFLKYPFTSEHAVKGKFSAYLSEADALRQVANATGLLPVEGKENCWVRHPLAYLVEAADDICYAIIDLEDGVELEILDFEEVFEVLAGCLSPEERERVARGFQNPGKPETAHRVNFARIRGPVFDRVVRAAIRSFEEHYEAIMRGEYVGELFEGLPESDPCRQLIAEAKEMARDRIFKDTRKLKSEIGSSAVYETLLEPFCSAALDASQYIQSITKGDKNADQLEWRSGLILRFLGEHSPIIDERTTKRHTKFNTKRPTAPPPGGWNDYQCVRRVLDYIGGMTDNYAVHVAQQLQGIVFAGSQRP